MDSLLAKPIVKYSGVDANDAAWSASLWPEKPAQIEKVVAFAEYAVAHPERIERYARPDQGDHTPEFLTTLGLALHRAGRDTEALERLERSAQIVASPLNQACRALVHQRLGHTDEAKRLAEGYREQLQETFRQSVEGRGALLLLLRELDKEVPT